ncbi:hypothetical protein FQ142_10170 [Microbacterium sp. ANT_H45B]|uniref:hypothetical protein n=1 Tax=Microbacterium sp. ANT_H45B TaxID=2597346 RepID=UPI0011EFEF53|nr:hypothetical protein [Microbacterium sp. ANT_H45B]KAA0961199.1 hypothetical protein FQ142_10170 [Microbacterium sp. ANT_H45B]
MDALVTIEKFVRSDAGEPYQRNGSEDVSRALLTQFDGLQQILEQKRTAALLVSGKRVTRAILALDLPRGEFFPWGCGHSSHGADLERKLALHHFAQGKANLTVAMRAELGVLSRKGRRELDRLLDERPKEVEVRARRIVEIPDDKIVDRLHQYNIQRIDGSAIPMHPCAYNEPAPFYIHTFQRTHGIADHLPADAILVLWHGKDPGLAVSGMLPAAAQTQINRTVLRAVVSSYTEGHWRDGPADSRVMLWAMGPDGPVLI